MSDLYQQYYSSRKNKEFTGSVQGIESAGGNVGSIDSAESIVKTWESDFKKGRRRNRYGSTEKWDADAINFVGSNNRKLEWDEKPKDGSVMYGKYEFKQTPSLLEGDVTSVNNVRKKYPRKKTIGHLKKIADVQLDIMSMLKRIEESSRKNTNCSTQNLEEQQTSIAEMEMSFEPLDDEDSLR